MRYGAHIYLWTERWDDRSLPLLDRLKGLGLDCCELVCGDDVHFDPRLARRHAESLDMTLTLSPGGLWPGECDISDDDPARRELGLRWHCRSLDLAGELGAVAYTGAIYGHPGTVRRRMMPADELARTAENLHELAEYGRARGGGCA